MDEDNILLLQDLALNSQFIFEDGIGFTNTADLIDDPFNDPASTAAAKEPRLAEALNDPGWVQFLTSIQNGERYNERLRHFCTWIDDRPPSDPPRVLTAHLVSYFNAMREVKNADGTPRWAPGRR